MNLDAPFLSEPQSESAANPERQGKSRLKIIDGDVHPALRTPAELKPYLSQRWWEHFQTWGGRRRSGMSYEPYPKSQPRASRRDAWPEEGGAPGSSLRLMREQYLDAYGIEYGLLGPLGLTGQSEFNLDFAGAIASAANDWQRETFSVPEPRLKSAIVVPYDDAEAAVREIDKRADDPAYAQVFMLTRSPEPAGRRRYWATYAEAERHGLPVGMHVFGASGHPYTGAGWPSYYMEEIGRASCRERGESSWVRGRVYKEERAER